jgi:hypothetical protein
MFTTHVVAPNEPGGAPAYYRHQLRSFAITDTVDTFRQGATAFRNARDWTKDQRDAKIIRANELARVASNVVEPDEALERVYVDSEGSIEEADVSDEENAEAESSSTFPSFAVAASSQLLSTQTEDEGGISTDDCVRSSAKRSPSQSPKFRRRKRKPSSRIISGE